MMPSYCISLQRGSLTSLAAIVIAVMSLIKTANGSIAAGLYTKNGYDNIMGVNAICWSAQAFLPDEIQSIEVFLSVGVAAANELVSGAATMMYECPKDVDIHLDPPVETSRGEILRTQQSYMFGITASINMKSIREEFGLSNETVALPVAGRVVFCPLNGNLCSPFVVAQSQAAFESEAASGHEHTGYSVGDEEEELQNDHNGHEDNVFDSSGNETIMPDDMMNSTRETDSETNEVAMNHTSMNMTMISSSPEDTPSSEKHFLLRQRKMMEDGGTPAADGMIAHDNFNIELLQIVEASSDWKFQTMDGDDIVIIRMVLEVFLNHPGSYLHLGAIQLLLKEEGHNSTDYLKIDIANLLHSAELTFQEPPNVRSISDPIKITVWVAIGMATALQLTLIFFTVHHRHEGVMKMSQGNFVILIQVAALFATISSFLFDPQSDIYCQLSIPLTTIPMQFMLSIVFGLLLRIVTIMGGLMDWSNPQTKKDTKRHLKRLTHAVRLSIRSAGVTSISTSEFTAGSSHGFKGPMKRATSTSRRLQRKFSAAWLWFVIIGVTLPQVLLQIFSASFLPRYLDTSLNDDESLGRYTCGAQDENLENLQVFGTILVLSLTLATAIYQAYKSRNLPAIFNEAASVSIALVTTLGISTLAITLIMATDQPMSSPAVQYLMLVAIVLNFCLNVVVRLVLPKLRLIWKGEKVVVSTILTDHRKKQRARSNMPSTTVPLATTPNALVGIISSIDDQLNDTEIERKGKGSKNSAIGCTAESEEMKVPESIDEDDVLGSNSLNSKGINCGQQEGRASRKPQDDMNECIAITNGYAPPSNLTVNVLHLHREVAHINERVLSALVVSKKDWVSFRRQIRETQRLLEDVEFQ